MGSQELDSTRRREKAVLYIGWQCIELRIEFVVKLDGPPAAGRRGRGSLPARGYHT